MMSLVTFLQIGAGLIVLLGGGELLVRGAVTMSAWLGVSSGLIGLTVVALGTSAPELVVSLQSNLAGQADIAVGNVVGSNIANILLVLGAAALVAPLASSRQAVFRDGGVMVGASLVLVGIGLIGLIARWQGAVLLAALIGFIIYTYYRDRRRPKHSTTEHLYDAARLAAPPARPWLSPLMVLGGFAGLMIGAKLLIAGSVSLARAAGVSEAFIGLTLVAVGTSLPELVTSVVASWRGKADLAIGNVIGSNIFNILGILGVAALVRPIPINPRLAALDLWVMTGVALAVLPLLRTGWRLTRLEGALMLALYVVYVVVIYFRGS